ncbi:hypothetical protein DFJ73DRAFT_897901 [Zopfochytrium polystomum]|nr:hypothetical protein DFJ73DRAFT_897901 [Zopfochytrium polystomum]
MQLPAAAEVPSALSETVAVFHLPASTTGPPRFTVVRAADGSPVGDIPTDAPDALPEFGRVREMALTDANHLLVLHGPDADGDAPLHLTAYDLGRGDESPRLLGSLDVRALFPPGSASGGSSGATFTLHASDDGRIVALCAHESTVLETPRLRADGTPRSGRGKREFVRTVANLVLFECVGEALSARAFQHEWQSHVEDVRFDGFVVAADDNNDGDSVVGFVSQSK